jgi:hypothetical protein
VELLPLRGKEVPSIELSGTLNAPHPTQQRMMAVFGPMHDAIIRRKCISSFMFVVSTSRCSQTLAMLT